VFVLIVLVDVKELFVHYLLRRSQVFAFVVIELYEQAMKIFSFEVNAQRVPLAMQTIVMEELGLVRIISLWLSHGHSHDARAYWAL